MGLCDGLEFDAVSGLQGVRGPAGPAGVQGPQGLRGLQGDAGSKGPDGSAGPDGPKGPAGNAGPQGVTGLLDTVPWQGVGEANDADSPELLNSWERGVGVYKSKEYSPAYKKTASGLVFLTGSIWNGEIGRPMFQLPDGFVPQYRQTFVTTTLSVWHYTYWAVVEVSPDGGVTCLKLDPAAKNTHIELSQIIFYGGQR